MSTDELGSLEEAGMMSPADAINLADARIDYARVNAMQVEVGNFDQGLANYLGITPDPAAPQGSLTFWEQDPSFAPSGGPNYQVEAESMGVGYPGPLNAIFYPNNPNITQNLMSFDRAYDPEAVPDILPSFSSISTFESPSWTDLLPPWVATPPSSGFASGAMLYGSAATLATGALASLWNAPVDTGSGLLDNALTSEGQFLQSTAVGTFLASNPLTAPYAAYQFITGLPSMLSTSVPNQDYSTVTYGMTWMNPDSLQLLSTSVESSAYGASGGSASYNEAYYNEVILPAYQQYGTGAAQYLAPSNNIFLNPGVAPNIVPISSPTIVQSLTPTVVNVIGTLDASDFVPVSMSEPDFTSSTIQFPDELPINDLPQFNDFNTFYYGSDSNYGGNVFDPDDADWRRCPEFR